jgi:hypothetical protein
MPTRTKIKMSDIGNLQTNYGDGFQFFKYLKDPAQPILDALDKDSSPKEDTWDSVSVVTFPENEQEGTPQSSWNQNADPSHQPTEGVL